MLTPELMLTLSVNTVALMMCVCVYTVKSANDAMKEGREGLDGWA